MSNNPEKKGVSAIDFFCIGFGAIVGVGGQSPSTDGWTSCWRPIPAAIGYIVALVMMIPIALCYCELVPMLPVAGGGMAFSYRAFNENVSFISGWAAFGAFVSIIPWEAIQITDVLGYLIPDIKSGEPLYQIAGTDVYLVTIIIGSVASLLLFALNMRAWQRPPRCRRCCASSWWVPPSLARWPLSSAATRKTGSPSTMSLTPPSTALLRGAERGLSPQHVWRHYGHSGLRPLLPGRV